MAGIMRRKGEKRVYTGREKVDTGEYKGGALRAKGQSRGGLTVGETVGYAAKRAGTDFLRVGEGVVDAALVPVDLLTGNAERAKSRFMDSPVDAMRERLDEEYNPGKVAGFIGDIAGGIGQSVGYGLISAIPYAGKPMMYSSIIEQSISSAAEKTGEVGWKEVGYGATAGAVEGLLESKLGAGVNAAKGIGSAILKKTGINVAESAAKAGGKSMLKSVLTDTAKGFAGEFAEEAISEAVDPALLRLYNIDENAQFSLKDVAYAGLIGGLSGGMMSAGPAAINYRSAVSVGRALQESRLDGELIKRARYTLSALEAAQTRSTGQIKGKPEGDTKETAKEWLSRTAENRKVKRLSRETKELADKIRRNIAAYEKSMADPAMAKSEPVAAILGELRGNLFLVGYAYEADVIEQVMMEADDKQRQAFVDAINEELAAQGKKHDYTLADFDANKDDIRRGLAGRLMLDELQGNTAEDGIEYGAEATEKPVEPAQAPKDTTVEQVTAQEKTAATEDLSGIEEEVWRAVTDETVKGYGTQNEQEVALLRAAVSQNVPEKSIPLMLERFREGTDMTPAEFADAWADGVLLFGRLGLNEEKISQESALSRMSEKARRASIEYGKWLSEEQRSKEQEAAKKKKRPVKEGESRKPKGEVVRHPGINLKADLDDAQFTAYKAAEIMAPALKADIEIHKGLERNGKQVNGYYDIKTNTIHINIDAVRDGKHIALYTLGHEVAHYIKAWSPKKFYELGDYVMDQLGEKAEKAVRDKLDFMKRNGLVDGLDETEAYDRAYEEVVADGMELVLTDGTVLDALARENKTLWQKIKDRIFEIIEKIKKAYGDLSKTSRTAQILSETMDSLDEIEQLFYEGVREAGERTRTAGVENTLEDNGSPTRKYLISEEISSTLSAEDQNLLFDTDFYERYENESREPITETVEELEAVKASEAFAAMSDDEVFDLNAKLKAKRAGYDTVYDYYVETEKERTEEEYRRYVQTGRSNRTSRTLEEKRKKAQKERTLRSDEASATPLQNAQYKIIQETNPMWDEYHTGIRSSKEIKTFAEVAEDPDSFTWGDFTREDARKALRDGTVRVYSSYAIKNGVFVSTSYQQALEYAGNDPARVHSRVVALDSVAWINGDEGQYAKVYKDDGIRYSIDEDTDTAYLAAVERGDMETAQKMVDKAAKKAGYTVKAYHGTKADFTEFSKEKFGSNFGNWSLFGAGFYFAPTESSAKYWGDLSKESSDVKVMPVCLRSDNMIAADEPLMNEKAIEIVRSEAPSFDESDVRWTLDRLSRFVNFLVNKGYTANDVRELFLSMGYDGVDYSSLSAGKYRQYVVFDPNQIKSSDPVTYDNNGNVIPLSERFKEDDPDIRYSIDDTPETPDVSDSAADTNVGSKTVEELEAENKRLTEKVQRMSFERFRRAVKDGEIEAKNHKQALSKGADAVLEFIGVHDGRNRRELLRRMSETYAHMAAEKGITYEEAFEESGEIAKWLISRQPLVRDAAMAEQAKETINTLRGTKIRLTYAQKMEVANTLGNTDEYRKAMFGRITVSDKDGVPLDVQWAEWADQYPDLFDKDTPEADMPERLREIYDSLADMRDRVETVDEYIDETALTATIFSQIGQIGYGAEAAPFNDRAILADMLSGAAVSEHEYKIIKDYKAASDELAANDRRLAELRRETAELNREIKVLQDKLRGIDKTRREPWVMTALTDAIKRKGELMDEMDALAAKIKKADERFFSLRAAAPVKRAINELNKKIKAEEKRAEMAETKAEQAKEWAKDTVKKAREESEKKVKKARQEATDYKRAVYRTAYAKADEKNQKYRDRLDEMAKQSMERREITIRMREARRVLGYLNTMLYHPTKQKHVPESLQALVEKALRSADPKQFGINRDHIREMSELAGKIRNLESKAGRTTAEQETLDKMKTKYEKLEADTISVKRQAEALMMAFEQYVTSTTDGEQIDKNMLDGLRQTVTEIEEAPLNEMTLESLKAVEKIYTVIYHQVNTANQAFATEKAASIDEMSTEANTQVKEAKELKFLSPRSREWAALAGIRSFLWKNMKPLTVFEAIGSNKLMEIFRRVLDAEDVWITDILEAKQVLDEAKKEFGYNKWNLKERREITTADGSKVSLTLGEMMSLYAYMFREQAEEHLSAGGFVFAPNAEAIESFKGDKVKYRSHLNDQKPHRMRKEDIAKMSEMLTEEQRAYAKTVQEYLTSLGAKGNEVSRKLYGIDLFKETAYFPIKSSHDYIETQTGKSGDPNIKSRGTFKETVPKAGNPIVLEDFMEVVGNHVNTMATYHAFVLPVEDLTRVWNYTPVNIKRDVDGKAILDENGMPVADTEGEAGYNSLKAEITKKYGKEANDYILQLLRDLNGGARRESAASILDKGLTAFKRSATMLSLSTIVQQPTSIIRAMAYVDAKHFTGASFVPWETVKKYAPVAAIKEVGGHDTNTGARTVDYINAKQYDSIKDAAKAAVTPEIYGGDPNVRAEAFGWLTGKADEVSWRYMFGAIVNEQAEKLGKAKDSEEVLKAAGKRFAEVVRRTQVYDSTLTRSEYMRSKDGLMKMATAFGAEPTTVVSMAVDAIIKAERGDKTFLRKSAAGIAFSIIANAAVASLIYAMRDDDEDETIPEKYVQSLTSELIEGFNPLEYLPIARDIMSMFKGYEIERSDMALIGNLMEQVELITSSKRSVPDKIFGVTGAVSAFFGLPVTNVYRDLKGLVKTGQSFTDAEEQTGAGFGFAMGDAVSGQFNLFAKLFGTESGNAYELYTSYVRGDTAHYERVKARYETDKDAEMALRTELRDNDKRINQAAWAKHTGDLEVYESLVDQIESEGIFDRNIVIRAVNNEVSEIKREIEKDNLVPKDETADEDETAESLYKTSDLNNTLERGDTEDFAAILAAIVEDKVSTGKTEAQAKASVKSSITAYWKKQYLNGYQDTETRKRIIAILTETGLYGSRNDVATMCEGWVKASK